MQVPPQPQEVISPTSNKRVSLPTLDGVPISKGKVSIVSNPEYSKALDRSDSRDGPNGFQESKGAEARSENYNVSVLATPASSRRHRHHRDTAESDQIPSHDSLDGQRRPSESDREKDRERERERKHSANTEQATHSKNDYEPRRKPGVDEIPPSQFLRPVTEMVPDEV